MWLATAVAAFVASGSAVPDHVGGNRTVQLLATVTGHPPAGLVVSCRVSAITDIPVERLYDDGGHGDGDAGDFVFGIVDEVQEGTPVGAVSLPCAARAPDGRQASFAIALTVIAVCGDGQVQAGETCDDGGFEAADGCDQVCQVEAGWDCAGTPSRCTSRCGDGLVVGNEGCDDGGHVAGDGCDPTCQVEPGWACDGAPSVCVPAALCGNGVIEAGEQCDDHNMVSGDGCDADCVVETGYECDGEPSVCCTVTSDGGLVCGTADAGVVAPDAGPAPGGGGGCCAASGGGDPGGALVFALYGCFLSMPWRWSRRRR